MPIQFHISNSRGVLASFLRNLCGVRPLPLAALPASGPCIFYANHSSHLDFAVLWAALPAAWRERTRPVAGRDYWEKTAVHRGIAQERTPHLNLPIDAGALRFRRRVAEMIEAEHAD